MAADTPDAPDAPHDALIVVSFGGPEAPEDVLPFLENVTRGRGVPRERLQEVAENYAMFGGVSPINAQNRALIAALEAELERHGPKLPVYFGNRNWHPFLADTVARMAADGVRRALAFVTSAYASYSGCRQYLENIEAARREVGESAPVIEKLRTFHDHPGFIEPMALNVARALASIAEPERAAARVVFTAHSLPTSMAESSDYVAELDEATRLVAERVGLESYERAYQSRSGPPTQPWLEPDILDRLGELAEQGVRDVVVMPIGFISDHMEVVYDLDFEAKQHADSLGLRMVRAETVGTAPPFVSMIRELALERIEPQRERRSLGTRGTRADFCPPDCCPPPKRPARPATPR